MHVPRFELGRKKGFTVIELLVVIVVIGILATIVIVSYGAWQTSTRTAQVKSDLAAAASAMEAARNFASAYPSSLPSTITPSSGVTLTLTSVASTSYCIDGGSTADSTIHYYIDSLTASKGAQTGTCVGRTNLPVPGVPTSLASASTTNSQSAFSWTPADAYALTYIVQCAIDQAFITGIVTASGANSPVTMTGMAAVTTYYCRVKAGNNNGVSAWSSAITVTTTSSPVTWMQLASNSQGNRTGCAISSGNIGYCWGYNSNGQLGNNTTTDSAALVRVGGGAIGSKTTKQISPGYLNTCAIASDNLAYCWGSNSSGQLGTNTTADSLAPAAVTTSGVLSGKTILSISTNYTHTCAIASDNLPYCWGNNSNGQLGNGTTTNSLVPVAVTMSGALSGKTIKAISVGYIHTCAIASDNLPYCWGQDFNNQLGNNSTTDSSVPVAVTTTGALSGKTIKSLSASWSQNCVIASDNNAYCWGQNVNGEIGNNTTTNAPTPVAVTTSGVLSGKTILSLSSGYSHTCVIASDNNPYCWGQNTYGGLGNNSISTSLVPVAVVNSGALSGKTPVSIVSGYYSTFVLATDGNIYSWGNNNYGQLGIGSMTPVQSLVPVLALTPPA